MQYLIKTKKEQNESGLVSIIIVTVVIIILSLMTTGFAKIMDRELRQSLDRELAVQANYAAEAGLNDARNYVANEANPDTGGACLDMDNLTANQQRYFVSNGNMASGTNGLVKYTCINIDTNPRELVFDRIPAGKSKIFKVITSTPVNNLYFGWNNAGQDPARATPLNGDGNNTQYPTETAFNNLGGAGNPGTGVLRVAVYPVPGNATAPANYNQALEFLNRSFFLYPNNSGSGNVGSEFYLSSQTNVNGNCNRNNFTTQQLPYKPGVKHYCNSRLEAAGVALPGLFAISYMYVRVTALYSDVSVSVQATDAANNPLQFRRAQGVIDVTAKGNDVLKRIKGVVSLDPGYAYPEYAVESMDTLCKRIRLPKTGANAYGPARYQDPESGDRFVGYSCSGGSTTGSNIPGS